MIRNRSSEESTKCPQGEDGGTEMSSRLSCIVLEREELLRLRPLSLSSVEEVSKSTKLKKAEERFRKEEDLSDSGVVVEVVVVVRISSSDTLRRVE